MKRALTGVMCVLMLGIITTASAQRGMRSPEENAKVLQERLDLSEEQMKEVLVILKAQRESLTELRNSGDPGPGMREKFMKISEETDKKIMKVLDEEQQEKYESFIKERREMRGRRRRG